MKNRLKYFLLSTALLLAFALWTACVRMVDVGQIGPNGSWVGFATLNRYMHNLTGVHLQLYIITDWFGLIPVFCCFVFAIVGLVQWVRRRSIAKVDSSILLLGVFYIVVFTAYLLFEEIVINYRPILICGNLEASYPSSTTLLVLCIMPTTMLQLNARIKNRVLAGLLDAAIVAFMAFMVLGRFISGVHWFSDIVGGVLLSGGLAMGYLSACKLD